MKALSPVERMAVERAGADDMTAQVRRWAAVGSGSGHREGLDRMVTELADAFSALPGEVRSVEPAPVERVAADGRQVPVDNGRHLHLTVRPQAPFRMLFTGHMDTVYPPDRPVRVEDGPDGTLRGPGTADMKGGLAVMLAALRAVEASPLADRLGYEVVVNSDEETGSLSSAALIAAAARGKAAAFTYEPALADGTLAGARGGSGNFALVVRGRAAHAGRNPADGRNALLAAAELALRLEAAAAPGLTVNPARIDGGGPNNVVPDLAVLRVNFRPADAAAARLAQDALDDAVAQVAFAREVAVEVHGGFGRPPKPLDASALRLFELVRDVGHALDQPVTWRATGGVCDGNNIAAAGVPVVDTMGVRGGAIHSDDEYMIPASLAERAALSAVTILRLAESGL